jgi:uncharacterized coiled-coil DUF342 family protein
MKGNLLSEEAKEEEQNARDARFAAEQKLDALRTRRRDLFQTVNRLTEEVMDLQRRRQDLQEEVQVWHNSFKQLGDKQRKMRDERTKMMDRLDELLSSLHQTKGQIPPGSVSHHKTLSREIADLEKQQQTKVMSLKEENALIDKIRQKRLKLTDSEKVEAKWMEVEAAASAIKKDADETRQKLAKMNAEVEKLRTERDEMMGKVKSHLAEIGHVLTEIRAKGKARSETLEKVKAVSDEMTEMGKKVLEFNAQSKARIAEARRSYQEHGEAVRRTFYGKDAQERSADEALTSLLKTGKIQLGLDGDASKWATAHGTRRKRTGD